MSTLLECSEIKKNYEKVLAKIEGGCMRGQQKRPRLIAVSKKQSIEKIEALYHLGHREFGENYYQELEEKSHKLKEKGLLKVLWVFIGRLQSNKIKKTVDLAVEIQSVGSVKHARLIDRYAFELKKAPYKVYLLVNSAEESSKAGFSWSELEVVRKLIKQEMPNLSVQGLMAIPPKIDLESFPINFYEKLYKRLSQEAKLTGKGLLSLGMSSDLEFALKYGSDCVRIGSTLFGKREEKKE